MSLPLIISGHGFCGHPWLSSLEGGPFSLAAREGLTLVLRFWELYICRAMTRPARPSSTAECLRLIARLRGEQASAASWEPRPPFEATEMD